ncbi:MAG TPA: chemotaxis protein CheW [Dokdonella sp.]|uniref:chemotaxis protein CheW n=1 Tax=Dokdonella sp. TaxID=2291710 RepID=UPI002D80A0A5|nr:chemotaxis protein CheW [Dokdonella sp.]HET9034313.1 chemotaxis protein CheW [Dokdonella sp.]
MAISPEQQVSTPFETLADYERRSLAHVAGLPEQIEAPGLWRGIGFRVGPHHLVSSISEVNEILTMPALTNVPGTQPWMLGVANVRGNLVALVDLRHFIEGERSQLTDSSRVLVVRQHGGSVGLLIDEVLGQRSFTDELREQAQDEEDERYRRYVGEKIQLGDILWGMFSMSALVRSAEFQQASA